MNSTVSLYWRTLIEGGKNNHSFPALLIFLAVTVIVLAQDLFHFTQFPSFYENGKTDFADILVSQCLPFLEKTTML